MTMKQLIRAVNDAGIYIAFICLFIFTALVSAASGALLAACVLIGGTFVLSFVYSMYSCASEVAEYSYKLLQEQKTANEINEEIKEQTSYTNYLLEKLSEKE